MVADRSCFLLDFARGGGHRVRDQGPEDVLVREVLLVRQHRELPRHRRTGPAAERANRQEVKDHL